jgi:UDP-3-O-[3-hydroxymyristoyl] glucosamine N-acyltransferase
MEKHTLDEIIKTLEEEDEQIEIEGNKNAVFSKFSALSEADENSLSFCKHEGQEAVLALSKTRAAIVLCKPNVVLPEKSGTAFIKVKNPRLAFAKLMDRFIAPEAEFGIHPSAIIGKNCQLGKVSVGKYVVIGDNVSVGDGTMILVGAVISDNVKIGKNSLIKSNAVIGQKGFGFEYDKDHIPFSLKHVGGVVIGDNVEVGANSVVCRGTTSDTIISDHVKIDDNVFIAHNVRVGARTLVIAGAVVCGSARIGEDCWLAPNCSIMNNISVGDKAVVGLGAVVIKSVPAGAVVAGNPARILSQPQH